MRFVEKSDVSQGRIGLRAGRVDANCYGGVVRKPLIFERSAMACRRVTVSMSTLQHSQRSSRAVESRGVCGNEESALVE